MVNYCKSRSPNIYVGTEKPSKNLVILTTFIVKVGFTKICMHLNMINKYFLLLCVYASVWFQNQSQMQWWQSVVPYKVFQIFAEKLLKIIDPVIKRSSYPETIILAMLLDESSQENQNLPLHWILNTRANVKTSYRVKVPSIELSAVNYVELVNWSETIVSVLRGLERAHNLGM